MFYFNILIDLSSRRFQQTHVRSYTHKSLSNTCLTYRLHLNRYWDQASALVQVSEPSLDIELELLYTIRQQLGLLSSEHLPVAGVEVARKVVDPFGLPSNTLMKKWNESESLSIQ